MNGSKLDLDRYANQLRTLPFVRGVRFRKEPSNRSSAHSVPDATLSLKTPTGETNYLVEVKATNISHSLAGDIIAQFRKDRGEHWMLFAHYVPPGVADELVTRGVQFVDEAGNCNLQVGDNYMARIAGRRPVQREKSRESSGLRGFLVYFALLASRDLQNAPIRQLEAAIGVSKSVVSATLARMKRKNLLVERKDGTRWLDRHVLLDRWLIGYPEIVRPRLLVGNYRTPDSDPGALETRLLATLPGELGWAFGGGTAASRLTGHFHGDTTILHVLKPPQDLAKTIRAVPTANEPNLTILRASGPLLLAGPTPHNAHSLLIYTELLASGNDRAREAAAEIRERFLQELS